MSSRASVAATNDSSTTSKASMCRLGYLEDEFVYLFVQKPKTRRAPIINRGYFVRTWAIQEVVIQFLTANKGREIQIVSLGAGFDTLYFRLTQQKEILESNCTYVEIDFPSVMERKLRLIEIEKLQEFFCDHLLSHKTNSGATQVTCNYWLLGCDLRNVENLHTALIDEIGLDKTIPTLIIAECVLTYLEAKESDAILQYFSETFSRGTTVVYEQILPHDGFGIFMRSHFAKIGSQLRTINCYPTIHSLNERYRSLGYDPSGVKIADMNYIYNTVLPAFERQRISKIEPFDEFEVWHSKCAHYVICLASHCKNMTEILSDFLGNLPPLPVENYPKIIPETFECPLPQSYGHAVSAMEFGGETYAIVTFGVGKENEKHGRVSRIDAFSLCSPEDRQTVSLKNAPPNMARCYHTTVAFGHNLLVLGGRGSPLEASTDSYLVQFEDPFSAQVHKLDPSFRARWRCGSCKLDGTRFVLCGGVRNGLVLDDFAIFDLQEDAQLSIEVLPDLPKPLHSHSCVLWKNTLLVSGGLTDLDYGINDVVWQFDFATKQWSQLVGLPPLASRYGHTSHVTDDDWLLLVGGVAKGERTDLEAVHLVSGEKKSFVFPGEVESKPILVTNHQSVLVAHQLYVIGGGGNCFSFGTLFNCGILKVDLSKILT